MFRATALWGFIFLCSFVRWVENFTVHRLHCKVVVGCFEVAASHTTLYPSYVQEANWNEKKGKADALFDCTWGVTGTLPVEVLVLFTFFRSHCCSPPHMPQEKDTVRTFSASLFGINSFLRTFKVQFCWSKGKNRTAGKNNIYFHIFAQNFCRVAICVTKTGKGNKVMPTNETMWKICRSSRRSCNNVEYFNVKHMSKNCCNCAIKHE